MRLDLTSLARRDPSGASAWGRRLAVAGLAGWVAVAGCQSKPPPKPKDETPRGYLNTLPGNAPSPGTVINPGLTSTLNPGAPQASLPACVREVLGAHDFPPPRVIEGSEGSFWAVSARPRSAAEVSQVVVQMTPKGEVTVELVGHARVGSSWPVLGELFQEPLKKEGKEIEKQIQDKLRRAPP